VFDGLKTEEEVSYYYPTADLVTAPEIMFFWVARMIIAGYEYRGEAPFKNVYYTGIVRDEQGRKMSKSLGNSPDPIELMEKYGADGVRVGMLLTSPAGNDLPFDEKLCEQGRNFANKIWNAFRLTQGWEVDDARDQVASSAVAVEWMESRICEVIEELEGQFSEFRLSEALMSTYRLVWDDFCSWYLELIKPPYGEPIDRKTMDSTVVIFEDLLKLLHPFMPFITEEIWHWIRERDNPEEAICLAQWPEKKTKNTSLLQDFTPFQQAVAEIRTIRKNNQIPQREGLELNIQPGVDYPQSLEAAMVKLTNLSRVDRVEEKVPNAFGFVVGTTSFFIPFGAAVDVEAEKAKIQKEIDHLNGFLKGVRGKLSNERFVQNAPDNVVELERKKESDALAKLTVLETKLTELG
jgi:valyl-tRNA synthetase